MIVRDMKKSDYHEVYEMWKVTSKKALSPQDEEQNIIRYLDRNEKLSKVAVKDGKIVGAVLIGHDSRIGFVHHLAVLPEYRRHNIGRKMMEQAIMDLRKNEVYKIYLFSFVENIEGQKFWEAMNFKKREDMYIYNL